jgi:hypothetical protein
MGQENKKISTGSIVRQAANKSRQRTFKVKPSCHAIGIMDGLEVK